MACSSRLAAPTEPHVNRTRAAGGRMIAADIIITRLGNVRLVLTKNDWKQWALKVLKSRKWFQFDTEDDQKQ